MTYYRCVGTVPRKRHTRLTLDGGVAYEEMVGHDGFGGPSSLLYHRRSPSAVIDIGPHDGTHPETWTENHPASPHHLQTSKVDFPVEADAVNARRMLLGNDDVRIGLVRASKTSPLYRSAVGDELFFVHDGAAVLESVFGRLQVGAGDYVVVPAGTTHRWVVDHSVTALVVEAHGHVAVPSKYLNAAGQLVEGAPFSERDQRAPDHELLEVDEEAVPVVVRTNTGMSVQVHATHPFDVVGWDGCVYPWALSIHDFEPIVGRVHQPPPVHQTLAGPNFVLCSFVPRPFDFDPEAVKVPYHHTNVDSDEVLFYAEGDFMSRAGSGIGRGSISLHPPGFVHGPQPGSRERSEPQTRTEEIAVMIDTFRPLFLSDTARHITDPEYLRSWAR
jgi:homogentisate 1,2-dioxygenase